MRHGNLNPACLPVPSDRHIALKVGQTPHFVDYWNFLVFPFYASFVDRSPIAGIALTLVQAHGDLLRGRYCPFRHSEVDDSRIDSAWFLLYG